MKKRYKFLKYCTQDVILPEPSGQNLHSLFKPGDAGSWSGMTKLGLLVYLILFGSPAIAQEKPVDWYSFEEAVQIAEENERFLLIDVWAPWCGWCKKMQKEVYPHLSENLSTQFVWTRLNRDDHESNLTFKSQNQPPFRVAQQLNVQSVPALVVLSPQGEYLLHTSGFTEVEILESVLEYIASKAYLNESFESFTTANQ